MDCLLEAYFNICKNIVFNKIGMFMPKELLELGNTGGRQTVSGPRVVDGVYNIFEGKIIINEDLLCPKIHNETYLSWLKRVRGGDLPTEKESWAILRSINNDSLLYAISVIIHEYGHWIHRNCFEWKSFRIPTEHSYRLKYCKKNPQENFAVGFEEYMLDLIPKDCKRYKKMEKVLQEAKEQYEIRQEFIFGIE